MRIAMIGSRGIPARAGGVERVVEQLSRELSRRGHDVLVYSRPHYIAGTGGSDAGRRIVTGGLAGRQLDTLSHTATAMIDVVRRNVDIVHIHSPGPALWSWIAATAGLDVVFTVHAADWRREKWSLPGRAALRAGLATGMQLGGEVTAVSRPLAAELTSAYGRGVIYIPNAPGRVESLSPDRIRRWGLTRDGYVLYVGRIEPEKRLDLLLRAWDRIESDRSLVVVGDASSSAYGWRCARCDRGNVYFLGPRFGAILQELYANAAVVVQPSVLEGMSLTLLEAAAHGRGILASRIAENENAMGPSIVYFNRDDEKDLALQLRRLLADKHRRKVHGERAAQWIRDRYCWSSSAALYEKLYFRLRRRIR